MRRLGLVGVVIAIAALLMYAAEPASAISYTAWKCVFACKYGALRAGYDDYAHKQFYWRGSTASGTCDPTNNITRWRMKNGSVTELGTTVYTTGVFGWKTNCSLTEHYYSVTVPRDAAKGNMRERGNFEWESTPCPACNFTDSIQTGYY